MKGHEAVEKWKDLFRLELPGEKAQLMMSPAVRGAFSNQQEAVQAAVLILVYPHRGMPHLVFMKRNAYDGPHSAQVSFPGGAWETGDRTLEATAIRETREELGITGEILMLGSLTQLHIPVSNFMVSPFAGWMDQRPEFEPDPAEVQYVIEAPLDDLLDPERIRNETMHHHGQSFQTPYYLVGDEKIGGATAMML